MRRRSTEYNTLPILGATAHAAEIQTELWKFEGTYPGSYTLEKLELLFLYHIRNGRLSYAVKDSKRPERETDHSVSFLRVSRGTRLDLFGLG
jgi:hypothetical protein